MGRLSSLKLKALQNTFPYNNSLLTFFLHNQQQTKSADLFNDIKKIYKQFEKLEHLIISQKRNKSIQRTK